ncbi:MAG: 3-hydroxyacyl-ACP dehydratase FabZ [Campylobacterales bacterium]|nr:3-hydroxyacyl-ACP dehydratase FabZ [Campylobacterales bacterium]
MLDVMDIQGILPHRYPFLLVDRVTELEVGKHIKAYKNVSIAEPVFEGHFPGHPIYPGVMILEGMAQAGGVLAFKNDESIDITKKVFYFTGIDKAKFKKPVRPGDKLEYLITIKKNRGAMWVFEGKAYVDGELASEAELKAMVVDK